MILDLVGLRGIIMYWKLLGAAPGLGFSSSAGGTFYTARLEVLNSYSISATRGIPSARTGFLERCKTFMMSDVFCSFFLVFDFVLILVWRGLCMLQTVREVDYVLTPACKMCKTAEAVEAI